MVGKWRGEAAWLRSCVGKEEVTAYLRAELELCAPNPRFDLATTSVYLTPKMKTITVKRAGVTLNPDRTRVLVRPFRLTSSQRTTNICARVMALSESEVSELLQDVLAEFDERHQQTRDLLKRGFERVKGALLTNQKLSENRQLLLGAYFTNTLWRPPHSSIPALCHTRINPGWTPVLCDLS